MKKFIIRTSKEDANKTARLLEENWMNQHLNRIDLNAWESEEYDENEYGELPSESYATEMLYDWLGEIRNLLNQNGITYKVSFEEYKMKNYAE